MAEYKVPLSSIEFAFNDVLQMPAHYQQLPGGEEATEDLIQAIMVEAAKFADEELAPLNQSGDEEGCTWNDGEVTPPAGFKEAYHKFVENGWPSLAQDPEKGGQGLPMSLQMAMYEMVISANLAWGLYPTITWGAVTTIEAHGTPVQKASLLPKMISGEWTGTMCLTEPHCGTDLGILRTKAEPNEDGSYNISGTKIFISSGEHDMAENIVHVTLARIAGAPEGTRGISLFLVPKFNVEDDGTITDRNGVSCGSIEHKMGIHGNATCVINFDNAKGYLIGQENRGLNAMFTFINESRVDVCLQAHGQIERAYQGSLAYAKDRLQMRAKERVYPDKPADPIIAHPEIRRILLTQRAFSEGSRLLAYDLARLVDKVRAGDHDTERELGFMTPIAKGFISEAAVESSSLGIQVYGGHGYIQEWGMEQYLRDARITTIYEGTTAVQGIDLITRKIMGDDKKQFNAFVGRVREFCEAENGKLPLVAQLGEAVDLWQRVTNDLLVAVADDIDESNSAAVDYLMLSGYVVMAYYLARMAVTAQAKAEQGDEQGNYAAKIQTAEFYFSKILPRTESLATTIAAGTEIYNGLAGEDFLLEG